MELGAFSLSLPVSDLAASRAFYEQLGFAVMGGDETTYVIMRNGTTLIGLFHGMFDKPMLTFNPGWDHEAQPVDPFTDVRDLQRALRSKGVNLQTEADENATGPGYLTLTDPDGNPILIDQHR